MATNRPSLIDDDMSKIGTSAPKAKKGGAGGLSDRTKLILAVCIFAVAGLSLAFYMGLFDGIGGGSSKKGGKITDTTFSSQEKDANANSQKFGEGQVKAGKATKDEP